ncbi:hypothetical protein KBY95_12825 [Cyanobium sp. Aljojuca 7A6]|nr:hypothetical protein [Cyanobium sp. Aljojuca 7A6]
MTVLDPLHSLQLFCVNQEASATQTLANSLVGAPAFQQHFSHLTVKGALPSSGLGHTPW